MSARKRGATGLSGVLLVDKPAGLTSHDVVSAVRRATGEGRVGHAGTLDPMATGLLVVLVGPATRLEPYLSSAEKSYVAEITFGSSTDTDDAEGAATAHAAIPANIADAGFARSVLSGFLGESMQQPPAYSAIKVGGVTAHRAARAGNSLELQPRQIAVTCAELISIEPATNSWRVDFTVSKGTYIRSLARDIGVASGSVAHLSALRRTSSGSLNIARATSLAKVVTAAEQGCLGDLWTDPIAALGVPELAAEPALTADGRPLPIDLSDPRSAAFVEGELVAATAGTPGRLLGIYRRGGDRLLPEAIFPGGVARGAL